MATAKLEALGAEDQKALRKLAQAVRRRRVDGSGSPITGSTTGAFYAVIHAGRLLMVFEHDPNSGAQPHRAARGQLLERFPELVDDDGVAAKPDFLPLDLAALEE